MTYSNKERAAIGLSEAHRATKGWRVLFTREDGDQLVTGKGSVHIRVPMTREGLRRVSSYPMLYKPLRYVGRSMRLLRSLTLLREHSWLHIGDDNFSVSVWGSSGKHVIVRYAPGFEGFEESLLLPSEALANVMKALRRYETK